MSRICVSSIKKPSWVYVESLGETIAGSIDNTVFYCLICLSGNVKPSILGDKYIYKMPPIITDWPILFQKQFAVCKTIFTTPDFLINELKYEL